ncbi:MAG: polar amino acid transport system substrate-binding protein [Paraglaciecola sp.]
MIIGKMSPRKYIKGNIVAWPLLASLLCFCCMSTLPAQEIMFVGEAVPPLILMDENKHKSGALVELAQALIDYTKITASIEILPWARAYEMGLNDANVILLSVLKTKNREPKFQWIGKVHHAKAHLIGLKSRNDIQISELTHAHNLRVGSVRGYGSATYLINHGFKEGTNLALTSNTEQMWGLLFNDRVDLVLSNFETSPYEILSVGYDPLQVTDILEVRALSNELQFATGHNTPLATVEKLTEGLSELKKDGSYAAIKKKWGLTTY